MRLFRSIWRSAMVVALLVAAVVDGQFRKVFLRMKVGPQGAVWVHGWCRRIVRALGFGVSWDGPAPVAGERGLAVVSNHLSYLDILLYASAVLHGGEDGSERVAADRLDDGAGGDGLCAAGGCEGW